MAKTYLEAHKGESLPPKIVLMDIGNSVGGTWAKERLYPGLKTNNIVGSYEFSDFPLDLRRYGLQPGQHIPGRVVHQYLTDFALHFDISPLIWFQTKVEEAKLLEDGTWFVKYSSDSPKTTQVGHIIARKIAVATGLTSDPQVPTFPGQSRFQGNIFHSRALRDRAADLTSSRNVVVVGGNKSAWDVCYTAARSGAKVTMLIRPSGGGPSWVWRPHRLGLRWFSISRLSSTRLCSWFDPTPFGNLYRKPREFLRFIWAGQMLCWLFWAILDSFARLSSGYNDECLKILRPWSSTFWMGNSLSIHNYDTDWFDFIRNGTIAVENAEITSLNNERQVHLSNGNVIEADTVVTCTGWKNTSTINYEPPEVATELGLSGRTGLSIHRKDGDEDDDGRLMAMARKEVLRQSPELSSKPIRALSPSWDIKAQAKQRDSTHIAKAECLRLYHYIVPPSERILQHRNLVFIGMHQSIHTVMVAQAQALWATAFFQNRIPSLASQSTSQVKYQTFLESEYEQMRRPREGAGSGGKYLDLVFDTVPYVDSLLEDVGVQMKRKASWWRDIWEPYTLRNYEGIVQEWLTSGSGSMTWNR